jgi:hypothetical protein
MELTVNYLLYEFTKVKNNIIEVMYKVLLFFHSLNFRIDTIRFDYGKVENSQAVLAFLQFHQITAQPAPPESQNQNPIERTIQTGKKKVGAIQQDAPHLKDNTWIFAWINWISNWNAAINSISGDKSPNQHILGIALDLSKYTKLKYGQMVASIKTGEQHNIAMPLNAEIGYFVSNSIKFHNASWIYFPSRHQLALREHVQPISTYHTIDTKFSYNNLTTEATPYDNTSTRADNNIHSNPFIKLDDQRYTILDIEDNLEHTNILPPQQSSTSSIEATSSTTQSSSVTTNIPSRTSSRIRTMPERYRVEVNANQQYENFTNIFSNDNSEINFISVNNCQKLYDFYEQSTHPNSSSTINYQTSTIKQ